MIVMNFERENRKKKFLHKNYFFNSFIFFSNNISHKIMKK